MEEPLRKQIYSVFAEPSGPARSIRYAPTSTRDLGRAVGVSRSVVLEAYDQCWRRVLCWPQRFGNIRRPGCVLQPVEEVEKNPQRAPVELRFRRGGRCCNSGHRGSAASVSFMTSSLDAVRVTSKPFHSSTGSAFLTAVRGDVSGAARLRPGSRHAVLREAICFHLRGSRSVVCDPQT